MDVKNFGARRTATRFMSGQYGAAISSKKPYTESQMNDLRNSVTHRDGKLLLSSIYLMSEKSVTLMAVSNE